jgi:hypothetical protein
MEKCRRAQRARAFRPARISFVPGSDAHFCIVHNHSERGLCIELTFEAEELPDHFEFSFDGFQTVYVCKTVWREDNVAGVSVEGPRPESSASRRAKFRTVG